MNKKQYCSKKHLFFYAVFFLSISNCRVHNTTEHASSYNLKSPNRTWQLPNVLREISGITMLHNSTIGNMKVACIQDEKGILFQYNLDKSSIVVQDTFYLNGDYEGIAYVQEDIYVLRSDGLIIEIKNAIQGEKKIQTYVTNIPAADNEGLCYDEKNNRLLIACKSKRGQNTEDKNKRMVYAFDLYNKTTTIDPVFIFDATEVIKFIYEKHKITLPAIKFNPSEIAIHPLSGKLYLLSATAHLLCIYSKEGLLEHAEMLDPILFKQPEGITFFDNGDMLISNEGKDKSATLLLFAYKK